MRWFLSSLSLAFLLCPSARATELINDKLETKLVSGPVEYSVLLPDGYDKAGKPYPLLLFLHGGGGDRTHLTRSRAIIEEVWNTGKLPKMVVATPSCKRSFYMDYKDGSQKWESFIVGPFLEHLRAKYNVSRERKDTLLSGISMGGMGSLRLGFKYPDKFGGLAALEPGIDPALQWKDVKVKNRFWRADQLMEAIYGKPFDHAYWAANNPATIAATQAEKIRSSKLAIYIECGDEDAFNLHEATEFLHRILWDNNIPHEYHLVRGADHLGVTVHPRTIEALSFLNRVVNPPPPDPVAEDLHKRLEPQRKRAEEREKAKQGK